MCEGGGLESSKNQKQAGFERSRQHLTGMPATDVTLRWRQGHRGQPESTGILQSRKEDQDRLTRPERKPVDMLLDKQALPRSSMQEDDGVMVKWLSTPE
ncbi:uncharacterized [Tachysurus ichikawai]